MLIRSSEELARLPRKHGSQDEVYTACQLAWCTWAAAVAATCSAWAGIMHSVNTLMTASMAPHYRDWSACQSKSAFSPALTVLFAKSAC